MDGLMEAIVDFVDAASNPQPECSLMEVNRTDCELERPRSVASGRCLWWRSPAFGTLVGPPIDRHRSVFGALHGTGHPSAIPVAYIQPSSWSRIAASVSLATAVSTRPISNPSLNRPQPCCWHLGLMGGG